VIAFIYLLLVGVIGGAITFLGEAMGLPFDTEVGSAIIMIVVAIGLPIAFLAIMSKK